MHKINQARKPLKNTCTSGDDAVDELATVSAAVDESEETTGEGEGDCNEGNCIPATLDTCKGVPDSEVMC